MNCSSCIHALGLLLLVGATFSGCSKDDPLNRQAISGTILFDGEALDAGSIEFHPASKGGTMSGAVITAGKYSISSERGLPPGEYIVRIYSADESSEPIEVPGESNLIAVEKIPEEYNTNSTLRRTVKPDEKNIFDIEISVSKD